ncbi:MAG TPA: hypothetical protein VJL61_11625 [Rhodanobacteraceae bacterium]|nr:hypothetical protein [Rhodanobacteraceae bacterium]
MFEHVFRCNDLRAMAPGIDHHVIRRIDVGAKLIAFLPYPWRRWLDRPRIRAPRRQAQLDPEFGNDIRKRLRRQASVGGLDQIDQVTAVAVEPENAAQNPLGCAEGSRFGRRERLPGMPITTRSPTVTIDRRLQV